MTNEDTGIIKKPNSRKIAAQILYQIDEEGAYANIALDKALLTCNGLDGRDKGFITELVYGTVKYRGHLDYVLNQFAATKVQKMDSWVRVILRMSLYQMLFLDKVPVSAAVDEGVKLAKKFARPGRDKFINGVLRNIDRGRNNIKFPDQHQGMQYLSTYYSFPQWIVLRMIKQYGMEQAEAMCQWFNAPSPMWVRVNTLKTNRASLADSLKEVGITAECGNHSSFGLRLTGATDLHRLDAFRNGLFTVQDESSMLVAETAAPKPGQRVLDVCGAPGGKTTHMAQLMQNQGEIIACDVHEHRLELIRENCTRLGVTNVKTMAQDGRKLTERWGAEFDVVLVDAPCSGLGVLGRRADSRWRKAESDIENLARLQREILQQAAQVVKSGGVLVYSTCTVTPEENQVQVAKFLKAHPEFTLIGERQYLPMTDQTDGFYISKMEKK